jgi:hypothetical protein
MKQLHLTGKLACALIATVAVISGCQKKNETPAPVPEATPAPAPAPAPATPTTEGGATTNPNAPATTPPAQTPPATTEPAPPPPANR